MKKRSFLDRATEVIARFFGSWWAVGVHTGWFVGWLLFTNDINLLMMWVSLEAIFIGIFLLMASNKAEEQRDTKEAKEQARQQKQIEFNTALNETQNALLAELRRGMKEIKDELADLRESLRKTRSEVIKAGANSKQ